MAGDCNLFLLDEGQDEEDNSSSSSSSNSSNQNNNNNSQSNNIPKVNVEIEIMIAEEQCRRKGLAKEGLLLLMNYAIRNLGITKFIAKVSLISILSIYIFCLFI